MKRQYKIIAFRLYAAQTITAKISYYLMKVIFLVISRSSVASLYI